MAFRGVHHTGIIVKNLDRSIYFYHDLLGLPIQSEPSPWFSGEDLAPNEILVSKSLADSLQARIGDTIRTGTSGFAPVEFTIYGIARPVGPGNYGSQPAIFLTLSALSTLTASDQINVVRLSSLGEGEQELENSKQIAPAVAASLLETPSEVALRVRTAKADDVNEIVRLAADNVPVNFVFSSVIILAGIALVVNLAIALAEERRPHLAVLRAMGLGRAGLVIIALSKAPSTARERR